MPETLFRFIIDTSCGRLAFRTARHPSESAVYLLCRVLAYAIHFQPGLFFSRGVCVGEEPAILSPKGPAGTMPLWIDIGLPGEKKLRQAFRQAERVILYTDRNPRKLTQFLSRVDKQHLVVYCLDRNFLDAVTETALLPTSRWHLDCNGDQITLNGLTSDRTRLFPVSDAP